MRNEPQRVILNKNGPIVVIEDDTDDQELLSEVLYKLNYPNKLVFFPDGEAALAYIESTDEPPFLILSDINMPKVDGFALRAKLKTDAELANKCIPYLFFSTAADQQAVINAYSQSVQGFFIKPVTLAKLERTLSLIIEYWRECAAPNDFT